MLGNKPPDASKVSKPEEVIQVDDGLTQDHKVILSSFYRESTYWKI
ncbi:hypothetical protein [Wolbachia endosymbiont of Mansonella perstans]|nr:hypothetical protein [Wolbachia endosymbiont of Mansonella perstans]MCA4774375.1 hypothetical protein [Wolbachia endosymbiont of Mansonella perstans]